MEQQLSIKQKLVNAVENTKELIASNKKIAFLVVLFLILILLFITASVLFFSKKSSPEVTTALPPDISSKEPVLSQQNRKSITPASLSLVTKNDKKKYKVNEEIILVLRGDTEGQVIRGYDGIFRFDKNLVSYTLVNDLFPKMGYVLRERGNWIILTAQQSIDAKEEISLKNTPLLEIRFKAIKPGIAYFPLSFVEGRLSDSNLMDIDSNDILTEVKGTTIQIIQ